MAREIYTAKLKKTILLSEKNQCKHFEFELESDTHQSFNFAPGQFVSMLAKNGDKQMTRAYSIASGPRGNKQFDLCLNRVEGGFFSNYLCDMEHGNEVHFHGPHGHFVLRDPLRDSVFIATGTGVAPMRGFVEWLFPLDGGPARNQGRQIWLVFGTRYPTEIYYREYFEAVAAKHPDFHYIVTLSRPLEGWSGATGYVQDQVQKILEARADKGKDSMDAYICGLNLMVSANRKLLADFGWDRKQIIFERYD